MGGSFFSTLESIKPSMGAPPRSGDGAPEEGNHSCRISFCFFVLFERGEGAAAATPAVGVETTVVADLPLSVGEESILVLALALAFFLVFFIFVPPFSGFFGFFLFPFFLVDFAFSGVVTLGAVRRRLEGEVEGEGFLPFLVVFFFCLPPVRREGEESGVALSNTLYVFSVIGGLAEEEEDVEEDKEEEGGGGRPR